MHPPARPLLVATDFSQCSERALTRAIDFATRLELPLVLLHVVELPRGVSAHTRVEPSGGGEPRPIGVLLAETATRELERQAARARAAGLVAETRVQLGRADEAVVGAATELGATAIVVGTHGRTGLRHLLLGSVAERVVRRAEVPVITVRASGSEDVLPSFEQQAMAEADG